MATKKGSGGHMLKWLFIGAFAALVAWHFWPATSQRVFNEAYDRGSRAGQELLKPAEKPVEKRASK